MVFQPDLRVNVGKVEGCETNQTRWCSKYMFHGVIRIRAN